MKKTFNGKRLQLVEKPALFTIIQAQIDRKEHGEAFPIPYPGTVSVASRKQKTSITY
jgi:hypothetical protein